MADIIQLRPAKDAAPATDPAEMLLVCECNCTTFHIRPGGVIECASCHSHLDNSAELGVWSTRPEPPVPAAPTTLQNECTVIDFMESSASFEHFMRGIRYDDTAVIMQFTNSGGVHTWGECKGKEQRDWLERRLETALLLTMKFTDEELAAEPELELFPKPPTESR